MSSTQYEMERVLTAWGDRGIVHDSQHCHEYGVVGPCLHVLC